MTVEEHAARSGRLRTDVAGPRVRPADRCYRFDRDFTGIGGPRIRRSSNTKKKGEFDRRNQLLTKLARTGQVAVLHGFATGRISIEELLELDDRNDLGASIDSIALKRNLLLALRDTQERMGPTKVTRRRYLLSLAAFARMAFLSDEQLQDTAAAAKAPVQLLHPERATVESLLTFDWAWLKSQWCFQTIETPKLKSAHSGDDEPATERRRAGRRRNPAAGVEVRRRSEADWNHLRRAISRFLTVYLGDKHNPIRHRILAAFPHAKEPRGVDPRMTMDDFLAVVAKLPEPLRPVPFALLLTGMRRGEYFACGARDLDHSTFSVRVPGTKTASSIRTAYVPKEYWAHIVASIPAPLEYKALRQHWRRAVIAAFGERINPVTRVKEPVKNITMQDLRRAHARWALEGGASLSAVQQSMGHETASMTMRYARDLAGQQVSPILAQRLRGSSKNKSPKTKRAKQVADRSAGDVSATHIQRAIETHRATLQALGLSGAALEAAMAPLVAIAGTLSPGG